MTERTKVYFGSWEGAFEKVEKNPELNLVTRHFDGHLLWILTEAETHKIVGRGTSLARLNSCYDNYVMQWKEG